MSSYNSSRPIRPGGFSSDGACSGAVAVSGSGSGSARGSVASTGRITTRLPALPAYRSSNRSSTASPCSASSKIRTSTSPSGSQICRCSSTLCSLRTSRTSPAPCSCNTISINRSAIAVSSFPFPIPNLRHVLAVSVDVLPVLNQLFLELLLQVDTLVAGLRQAVDGVHHEVEAVQIVQHRHVEGRGDGALFLVAADVDVVVVGAAVGQPVDQPRVGMEREDHRLVLGEDFVEIRVAQAVRVFARRLQPHQVDDVDHPDFQLGQMLAHDGTAASVSSVGTSPQ